MPRTKAVTEGVESVDLTPEDIARYYELKEVLTKPLLEELAALETRLKTELDEGSYPTANGYLVKRWEQIGALKAAEFTSDKPVSTFPELYADEPDIGAILELITPDSNPELFVKVPSVVAIKELLNDAEKKAYFKQSQYLKITKVESK